MCGRRVHLIRLPLRTRRAHQKCLHSPNPKDLRSSLKKRPIQILTGNLNRTCSLRPRITIHAKRLQYLHITLRRPSILTHRTRPLLTSILRYLSKIVLNLLFPKPCTSYLLSSRHHGPPPPSLLHLPVIRRLQQRRHLGPPHIPIRRRRITHIHTCTCSIRARLWALYRRPHHPCRRHHRRCPCAGHRWSRGVALEVGG